METRKSEFGPSIGVKPFGHHLPDNDEKSLDDRFREGLEKARAWKYMPAHVTRSFTLDQRIHRAKMMEYVREIESIIGFPV